MSQVVDDSHLNLQESWQTWNRRTPLNRLARWIDWRVTKKAARWSGRAIKRSVPMFWGQEMTIVYPEYVSGQLGRHGFFEHDVTSAMIDVLQPGMTFYDVGAHFGFYSLLASTAVGESGQVHAFEPAPSTFPILSENAQRRGNIQVHNLAVFNERKTLDFWQQELRDSAINFLVNDTCKLDSPEVKSGRVCRVQALPLDEFVQEHGDPDVIKLDVEGVEGPVLSGMSQLLQRRKPVVSMEVGDVITEKTNNQPCRENVQFLMDFGYEVFEYRDGQPRPHTLCEVYEPSNLLFRHPQG